MLRRKEVMEQIDIPDYLTRNILALSLKDAHERAHKLNDELQEVKIERDVLIDDVLSLGKRLASVNSCPISLELSPLQIEMNRWSAMVVRWSKDD